MIGEGWAKVVEPQGALGCREYVILWKRQQIDLAELAKRRWVENWTIERLALEYRICRTSVKRYLGICKKLSPTQ